METNKAIIKAKREFINSRLPLLSVVKQLGYASPDHPINKNINCPFHDDGNPSMQLYPSTNSYYCFGCGASGDVVAFLSGVKKRYYKDIMDELFIALGGDLSKITESTLKAQENLFSLESLIPLRPQGRLLYILSHWDSFTQYLDGI